MRRMIRVGAAMFALLVAANVAVAQGGGGGGGGRRGGGGRGGMSGQQSADALLANITLDDATKSKIADVVKWYDDERAKITQPQRGDSAGQATAMAARTKLTADFRTKLRTALTPAQAKAFDANVVAADSAAAAMRGRGRRGGGL